jgi:hypothetical protein
MTKAADSKSAPKGDGLMAAEQARKRVAANPFAQSLKSSIGSRASAT